MTHTHRLMRVRVLEQRLFREISVAAVAVAVLILSGCAKSPQIPAENLPEPSRPTLHFNGDVIIPNVTSLHDAVDQRNVARINALLEAGADVNSRDVVGHTALHGAAIAGYVAVLNALLDAGADVNAQNEVDLSPLHYAAVEHVDAVRALLEAGADVNARDILDMSPLHWAADNANTGAVRILLEAGADVNARDSSGQTPLHEALTGYSTHTAVVVGALLDAGANPKARRNKDSKRPLDLRGADMLRIMNEGTYRRLEEATSQ